MENNEIEKYLNLIVEDLYQGLKNLADTVRDESKSRRDIATVLDGIGLDICRHWPFCNSVHSKELK